MSEVFENYRAARENAQAEGERNLAAAEQIFTSPKWEKKTPWVWVRRIGGATLEFWPTKKKWRWKGATRVGYLKDWIVSMGEEP